MMKPSKKALRHLLLLLLTLGYAVAVPAQQMSDQLLSALQEARVTGISETVLEQLLALAYERQFEPSGMVSLLPILAQCKRENLPLEPFVCKIEEGISKRIQASRIKEVLLARQEDYRFTRSLIAKSGKTSGKAVMADTDSHVRLTETLYCGLSRENLRHLLDSFPAAALSEVAKGAEILASLRQLGFDPQLAEQIVHTGLKQGYFVRGRRDLARIAAAAKRKGLSDDQIAATTREVMQSSGSLEDLSSRLGVTDKDLERHGPQVEEHSREVPSERQEEAAATAADGDGVLGDVRGESRGSSDPALSDGSDAVRIFGIAVLSGLSRSTKVELTLAGADSAGTLRGSNPIPDQDAGGGSNNPFPTPDNPKRANITFTAAGEVIAIDPDARTLTLDTVETHHVPAGHGNTFAINDKVTVKAKSPELGIFELTLADIAPEGDYLRVMGKVLADGTCLIKHIVLPLGGSGGSGSEGPGSFGGPLPENMLFAAAGTVVAVDPDGPTLTLDIDQINPLLGEQLGDEVLFGVSAKVRIKAEDSGDGVSELAMEDLVAGDDYARVLARRAGDGTYLVSHIVVSVGE